MIDIRLTLAAGRQMLRVRPAIINAESMSEIPWSRIKIGALGSTRLPLCVALTQPPASDPQSSEAALPGGETQLYDAPHLLDDDVQPARRSEGYSRPGEGSAGPDAFPDVCSGLLSRTTFAAQAPKCGDKPGTAHGPRTVALVRLKPQR